MAALNILIILLSFINSVNKKGKNADVAQTSIGGVVLCDGEVDPNEPGYC